MTISVTDRLAFWGSRKLAEKAIRGLVRKPLHLKAAA